MGLSENMALSCVSKKALTTDIQIPKQHYKFLPPKLALSMQQSYPPHLSLERRYDLISNDMEPNGESLLTWACTQDIDRLILVAPPNAGSLKAITHLIQQTFHHHFVFPKSYTLSLNFPCPL